MRAAHSSLMAVLQALLRLPQPWSMVSCTAHTIDDVSNVHVPTCIVAYVLYSYTDASLLVEVSPDHVDGLAAVLDDLAGDWYRFTGLLGVSVGKRRQIQLNSAWKPDGAQLCLLDALHLWVKSDEAATYEKITTVLQKHFPSRAHPLITAVRDFAEQQAVSTSVCVCVCVCLALVSAPVDCFVCLCLYTLRVNTVGC